MKKVLLAFLLFVLVFGISACSSAYSAPDHTIEFSSSEEMLQQLAGMWMIENNDTDKTYYIFQNNEIYITKESKYSIQVENVLNDAVRTGGLTAWSKQNLWTVSDAMQLSDVANIQTVIDYYPNKGQVKLNAGTSTEASIFLTDSGVFYYSGSSPSGVLMSKISDTADFTSGRFPYLFDIAKGNYTAPREWFFPSAETYANVIKESRRSLHFDLVQEKDGASYYTCDSQWGGNLRFAYCQ